MKKDFSELKVALVTDSMLGFGGSDRLLFTLIKIFPNSEIFTSVYNPKKYNTNIPVNTSFIQKLPFFRRQFSFMYPFVFEQFTFPNFDLVISLSAGPAKGIITQLNQPHIGIVLTPPRHQWDREINVRGSRFKIIYKFISIFISHYLRIWDISASKRIDYVISISKYIQKKVKRIYNRDSTVIYPGLSKDWFESSTNDEIEFVKKKYNIKDDFVLVASRLFDHKRNDWAIEACKRNNQLLYIIGEGPDMKYLKKIAGNNPNIIFLGHIPDNEMKVMHSLSNAFLFCGIEDFGYMPLEAMAQGKPVFFFNEGGLTETVVDGKTGALFNNIDELSILISKKAWTRYNPKVIQDRAKQFSEDKYISEITKFVKKVYETEGR